MRHRLSQSQKGWSLSDILPRRSILLASRFASSCETKHNNTMVMRGGYSNSGMTASTARETNDSEGESKEHYCERRKHTNGSVFQSAMDGICLRLFDVYNGWAERKVLDEGTLCVKELQPSTFVSRLILTTHSSQLYWYSAYLRHITREG